MLALNPLSANDLLSSFGTVGVLVVLFAETGLLIGFFLPGDSLLFTAGLLAATGAGRLHLSLPWVLVAAAAGALGGRAGRVPHRPPGRVVPCRSGRSRPKIADGMRRAEELFARYGPGQGHRSRPVHPGRAHHAQPRGRCPAHPAADLHPLAGRRGPRVDGRARAGRVRASARPSRASTPTCCP